MAIVLLASLSVFSFTLLFIWIDKNTVFRSLSPNCAAAKFLFWSKKYFVLGLRTSDNFTKAAEQIVREDVPKTE